MAQLTLTLSVGELAALLNVLNIALPEAPALVREGELRPSDAWLATQAFDDLCDDLTKTLGNDDWLQEGPQ